MQDKQDRTNSGNKGNLLGFPSFQFIRVSNRPYSESVVFLEEKEEVQVLELERFVDNSMITQRSNQKTWRIEGEPVSTALTDGASAGDTGSGTTPADPKDNKGGKKKRGGKTIAEGKTEDRERKEAEATKDMKKEDK